MDTYPGRTTKEGEALTAFEMAAFDKGDCPDCGETIYCGARAPGAQNVVCNADDCGSRFNMIDRVVRLTDARPKLTWAKKRARGVTARLIETFLGAEDMFRKETGPRGVVFEEMRKIAKEFAEDEGDLAGESIPGGEAQGE